MKVAVIGAGHVGLVTAASLSSIGHDVTCMDVDPGKVRALAGGRAPFHEPDLDELLAAGLSADRLRFSSSISDSVGEAQVVFVCVGRPPVGLGDKSLAAVEDAARQIARAAAQGVVLVVKSTVPPGTCGRIETVVRRERRDLEFAVVSSPEFLREGHAVDDTLQPVRIVVGSDSDRGRAVLRELYAPTLGAGAQIFETDPRTAELSKLASNAFLATKISFANALARLSELIHANVGHATAIMGADPRIGPDFLHAGLGYGGYCLPKDVVTLERFADRQGYDFALLREVARINAASVDAVTAKVEEGVWNLEGKRIALLGLAFKAGTDDVRGAPALELGRRLVAEGAAVVGWDPMAGAAASAELPALEVANDPYTAAVGAHCAVICTEWPELRDLDLAHLASAMADRVLVDGRNVLEPDAATKAGFAYSSVGRPGTETVAS